MGCARCNSFDTEAALATPEALRSLVETLRAAVANGALTYNAFESSRELIGQPAFSDLDLTRALPEVLRYHFDCPHCGTRFALFADTRQGTDGRWFRPGAEPESGSSPIPNLPELTDLLAQYARDLAQAYEAIDRPDARHDHLRRIAAAAEMHKALHRSDWKHFTELLDTAMRLQDWGFLEGTRGADAETSLTKLAQHARQSSAGLR